MTELSKPERIKPQTEYGDAEIAYRGEILRSTVGSELHGIGISGTDDHDEMGVFIEPMRHVLGLSEYLTGNNDRRVDMLLPDRRADYTARTAKEGERSYHGDTDLSIYSLKKYLRLAIVGNPTAILPLYAPEEHLIVCTELGHELRDRKSLFLSQLAIHRFLGYMEAQHQRMMGEGKRNRVPKRPELEEKYGWDTKYGSHAYRLAIQGFEIAATGNLTLPLHETMREQVLMVKRGEISQKETSDRILELSAATQRLLDTGTTAVPELPDVRHIELWMLSAQRRFWAMDNHE